MRRTAFFILWLTACEATGPADTPRVTVGASEQVAPGGHLAIFVTATPPAGGSIDRVRLEVRGLVTFDDSVAGDNGTVAFSRSIRIPADATTGELVITAIARSGASVVRDTVTVDVGDSEPPRIETLVVEPSPQVNPEDVVNVTLGAQDDEGLRWTLLRFSDAFSHVDSVDHNFGRVGLRTVSVPIPADAALGRPLVVTAEAVDAGGNRTTRTASTAVVDSRPPFLSASFDRSRDPLSPGDTLRIRITASDTYRLDHVGYRIGSPAVASEVFPAGGKTFSRVVTHVVDESWNGIHQMVVTARDAGGHVEEAHFGSIWIVNKQFQPATRTVALGPGSIHNLVYDAKRDVVYISRLEANRIDVASLDGSSSARPLLESLPQPFGIDLTPSGDTLLIAPRRSLFLYVYDLVGGRLDSLRITDPVEPVWGVGLHRVRAMAEGVALVSVTYDVGGGFGKVVSADLGTGETRVLTNLGPSTVMARSGDARKAIVIDDCCLVPFRTWVYEAATGGLSGERRTVGDLGGGVSADSLGTRFLLSQTLFSADLTLLREYQVPYPAVARSVVSMDGTRGYFATPTGFSVVRLADGRFEAAYHIEVGAPGMLVAVPNKPIVLAVVGTTLHIVDLQ